jgi:hypothetical protein
MGSEDKSVQESKDGGMPGKHGFRFQSSGSELILRIAIMG